MSNKLINAAIYGNLATVRALLQLDGININATDKDGNTALIKAAAHGHADIVTALLAQPGCDVNVANKLGNTALIEAARNGHTEIVTALLAQPGCDVNVASQYGDTALITAAEYGKMESVAALLNKEGININTVNNSGCTALIECAANIGRSDGKHHYTLRMLLDTPGIDVNVKNKYGYTARMFVERSRYQSTINLFDEHRYKLVMNSPNKKARQSIIDAGKMEGSSLYAQYLAAALPDEKTTSAWYGRGNARYRFMYNAPSQFLTFVLEDTVTPVRRRLELLIMLQDVTQKRGAIQLRIEKQQTLVNQINALQKELEGSIAPHDKKETLQDALPPAYTPVALTAAGPASAPPPSYAAARSSAPAQANTPTNYAQIRNTLQGNASQNIANPYDDDFNIDARPVVAEPPRRLDLNNDNQGIELQTVTNPLNYDAINWPVVPSSPAKTTAKASPAPVPEVESDTDKERQLAPAQ